MQIKYTLSLPRDSLTVPVVRRLCKVAMLELGVVPWHVSDVALAVTEACANVIKHSEGARDEYEVVIAVSGHRCVIEVVDKGPGFEIGYVVPAAHGDPEAEGGRGIALIGALVDIASFESCRESGTVVRLEKRLELEEDSLFHYTGEGKRRDRFHRPAG